MELNLALSPVADMKVLLIDLENYPSQINELPKVLTQYHLVVICYAQSNARIPIDWLMPLNDTINKAQLKIFRMTSNGKNAADFGISFYAGMLMSQLPPDAHFVIMSDDQDLDHVVNLLKNQQRSAERLGMRKDEPKAIKPAAQADAITSAAEPIKTSSKDPLTPLIKLYCAHLITYKKNRPAKKTTLLNSITNKLGDEKHRSEALFQALVKLQALQIQDTKVQYFDKRIVELTL
jgi:hypothetical protein